MESVSAYELREWELLSTIEPLGEQRLDLLVGMLSSVLANIHRGNRRAYTAKDFMPDFDALIYPGIRADGYVIPKDMPVTFMLCADNDRQPSTALSVLYPKLKAAGINTELHVYASGGHGFGIYPGTKSPSPVATSWHVRLGEWLKDIGMLKAN